MVNACLSAAILCSFRDVVDRGSMQRRWPAMGGDCRGIHDQSISLTGSPRTRVPSTWPAAFHVLAMSISPSLPPSIKRVRCCPGAWIFPGQVIHGLPHCWSTIKLYSWGDRFPRSVVRCETTPSRLMQWERSWPGTPIRTVRSMR